ncbi:MAG: ribonuclease J [Acidimicrobiia bacterium]|nr:ribonuclease J [Acidimicrobiia bacterium]
MTAPVRIVFLGGLGEIGRNCFCLEVEGRLLVVDCGLMFPTEDMPGVDLVLPDLRWILDRADDLEAVILTHGHEDHIGGVAFLLKELYAPVPIYGTDLTLGLLANKLDEAGVSDRAELRVFADGDRVQVGPFDFETIAVTHSTPHAVGLAFRTPQGVIVHTGDFKLDQTPVDGRLTDLPRFGTLGAEGVRLLLSDSTNAEHREFTRSESLVGEWLADLFHRHEEKRIICACFASHLHRVQQICDAAVESGRRIAFLGRSMQSNTRLAREKGLLDVAADDIVDISEIAKLDPRDVCVLCTGAQGEPLAALSLMASGEHKWVTVGEQDAVIISATAIPGNEMNVHRAIDGLIRAGAEVVHAGVADVHVSGHAGAPELELMLALVRPEFFVPVHGEYRHLVVHSRLATRLGIPDDSILVAEDGDVLEIGDDGVDFADTEAPAGYVYVDGAGVGDVTGGVLRERRRLADDGTLVCVVCVDSRTGEVVSGPEIMSKGFLRAEEEEKFIEEAIEHVIASIDAAAEEDALDLTTLNRHVRQALSRFARKRTERRPIVFPLVVEV